VWRLIGFQFLHANSMHLLFNMVALFFFGPMVERYLGAKRYLAFYLLCGICGALLYLALNLLGYVVALFTHGPVAIPWLLFNSPYQPLVGASAGIFGVLMAGAYLAPNEMVALFFVLPMRLVTLAYGLVILAVVTVAFGGPNAGGEAGHLGGAAAGFYFIRHPHHLHGFFDFLGWVDPTSHHYRRGRGARGGRGSEVDRVLAKVTATGLDSLSEREKRILREAAERNK
jgi:membrane associated rhomboid family serine protease